MRTEPAALRAAQALSDFRDMGPSRSIAKLWQRYVDDNRNGIGAPTTNRQTLYDWAKAGQWAAILHAEDAADIEEERTRRKAEIRKGNSELWSLVPDAILALKGVLTSQSTDDAVRLRAAAAVLDRTGFPALPRAAGDKLRLQDDATVASTEQPPQRPADDASDTEWRDYLERMVEVH